MRIETFPTVEHHLKSHTNKFRETLTTGPVRRLTECDGGSAGVKTGESASRVRLAYPGQHRDAGVVHGASDEVRGGSHDGHLCDAASSAGSDSSESR